MLRPSLGAAWLAWQIGPPVGFGAEPSAVAGPPSQRAAPPAWRPLRPSLEPADRNFKRPSGSRLPTTCLRVTGLMLRPSLGAACLAWQIGPPVGFGAEPSAVAGPPSQRAAPPAWRPLRPSLELRTSGPRPPPSPAHGIATHPPVHSRLGCSGGRHHLGIRRFQFLNRLTKPCQSLLIAGSHFRIVAVWRSSEFIKTYRPC